MSPLAKWFILIAAAACLTSPLTATSQAYPTKPVKLIVPIVPGGSVDLIARRFAQKMGEAMGQPLVVENIAGASGTIGSTQVAKAAPDGYTIMWATVGETIVYLFLSRNRPYDSVKDFTPIMAAVSGISVLAAHPSTPGNTLKEVLEYARANPGKLAYASAGIGSYFHMTAELFKAVAGVDLLHVPLQGRSAGVGPAGMPQPVVARLSAEANKALVAADMREYLDSVGFVSVGGTPEDLAALHRKGIEVYAQAAKLAGLKPE